MLWVLFAMGAALGSALMPLAQERFKVHSYVLACWIKVVTVVLALPFVLLWGLPDNPNFYLLIAATAVIYSISDVIYFRVAADVGAGVLTRLLPAAVIGTFFLWFLVDPALLATYAAQPLISAGIVVAVLAAAFFAMQLKKCAVSWRAVRMLWPVLIAAAIGPLFAKPALGMAPQAQAVAAYMLIQSAMMLCCWAAYGAVRRPVPMATFFSVNALRTGALIGALSTVCVVCKCYAFIYADHPAYPTILIFTDSVWVLLFYKLLGRPNDANVWAGMGIVGAATALVFFKALAQ